MEVICENNERADPGAQDLRKNVYGNFFPREVPEDS